MMRYVLFIFDFFHAYLEVKVKQFLYKFAEILGIRAMAKKHGLIDNLKKRWGVKNAFQVIIILIVFSCTGFSVLYVEDQIYKLLNITGDHGFWMRALLFIIITLPVYNVLLLIYGFIFGQFRFFWNFEKRFFGRIFGLFGRKS